VHYFDICDEIRVKSSECDTSTVCANIVTAILCFYVSFWTKVMIWFYIL